MIRTAKLRRSAAVIAMATAGLSAAQAHAQAGTPPTGQAGAPLPTDPQPPVVTNTPAQTVPEPVTDPEAGALQDIVVTAQRRSENLQRVPISVAVVTAGTLQAGGIGDVQSIKIAAPGVEVQSLNGYAIPVIRGVGSKAGAPGLEPPIAFYVDGVYYANPTATILGFNNIQQVEVLKGPQGTLFGRNATGGLIQITTKDPRQEFGGQVNYTLGNYETVKADGYITGGISENIAADLAVAFTTMGDGYGTNLFNGRDVYKIEHDIAVRSKWMITLGDQTDARFIIDYADFRNSFNAGRTKAGTTVPAPFGPAYGGRAWDINTDQQPLVNFEGGGVSLRLDHDFGGVSAASITAYRESDFDATFDFDYGPTRGRYVELRQKDWQFSQELQLLSPSDSPITYVAGAYYFRAASSYPFLRVNFAGPASLPTNPRTVLATTRSRQETDSISGFGQATAELFDGLKATVGLRYTTEKRTLRDASTVNTRIDGSTLTTIPEFTVSERFNKLTWRFALDYTFSDQALGYASYNRGFKSGGFNPNALAIGAFEPEVLDAYEVGLKTTLADRRVRFNIAGFYYDYDNVQIQRPISGATGVYNSGPVEIYGLDVELEAQLSDSFNVRAGYQWLPEAEYNDFPLAVISTPRAAGGYSIGVGPATGNRLALAPKSTLNLQGSYTVPVGDGDLNLNASYYYNSGSFQEPDNTARQRAYHLVNLTARYVLPSGVSVAVYGKNLANEAVANVDSIQSFGATGANRITYAEPRTYGVTFGYAF